MFVSLWADVFCFLDPGPDVYRFSEGGQGSPAPTVSYSGRYVLPDTGEVRAGCNQENRGSGPGDDINRIMCDEESVTEFAALEESEILDECCACDEAKYEVIFEGLWSKYTHPKDFPTNFWLTHFSDIIGASHSTDFRMWEYGGYASDGLQQAAELGVTKKLEAELKQESNKIRTIIKARGLWYPNLNGKTFAVFRADRRHHLMSLVSMLGPSPDWIVGVSSLELCLRNCSWASERVIDLYLWDAGTDSGMSYLSPNTPTSPHERIRRITPTNPDSPESPFYDPNNNRMKPFARLTVTRQRMYEKPCEEDNDIGVNRNPESIIQEDTRGESTRSLQSFNSPGHCFAPFPKHCNCGTFASCRLPFVCGFAA